MSMLRLGLIPFRYRQGLPLHFHFNGLEGTTGNAAAAHGTAFSVIFDFPGQVIYTDVLSFYCFHLCTSKSLSITTISRSLG